MSSRVNPDKVVDLGEYKFYFGNRALRQFETESGTTIGRLMTRETISFNDITILMKCGLSEFHRNLTLEDVDYIMDEYGINKVIEVAFSAVTKSLPPSTPNRNGNEEAEVNLQEVALPMDGENL